MRENNVLIPLMAQGLILSLSLTACEPGLTPPLEEDAPSPQPGSILWTEGWERAELGTYVPDACDAPSHCTFIDADTGSWYVGDTVSSSDDCGPTPHRAEVIFKGGSKRLKLFANDSNSGCVDNIWVDLIDDQLAIPLTPDTHISFYEIGELLNPVAHPSVLDGIYSCGWPPCGDKVYLRVGDNGGMSLVYVLQRSPEDAPFPTGSPLHGQLYAGVYREVFLNANQEEYERNLFADFSRITGFEAGDAKITHVTFEISTSGCALDWATLGCLPHGGWAVIDDITITECEATGPTGACCLYGSCIETSEECCTAAGGTYQGDETSCDENACRSIVIAIGGWTQAPPGGSDVNPNYGTFQIASELAAMGYDVRTYDEDAVDVDGSGPAYNNAVNAIGEEHVSMVAIFGYSRGGGSAHDLAYRLNLDREAIGTFTISFTAYIDAIVNTSEWPENTQSERLRPPSEYHLNYYQRHAGGPLFLMGDSVPGADVNVNVTDPDADPSTDDGWRDTSGQLLTHFTIDDDVRMRHGLINALVSRLGPPPE